MKRQKTVADVSIDSFYSPLLDLKSNFVWMKYCLIGRCYNKHMCRFCKKNRKVTISQKVLRISKISFQNMLYVCFQTFFLSISFISGQAYVDRKLF